MSESAQTLVQQFIAANKVAVFSKSFCPFCQKVKALLGDLNVSGLSVWELENHEKMNDIQDYLKELTGARSVPRVFVSGKFIGGCDDVLKLNKSGKLQKMLIEAGSL